MLITGFESMRELWLVAIQQGKSKVSTVDTEIYKSGLRAGIQYKIFSSGWKLKYPVWKEDDIGEVFFTSILFLLHLFNYVFTFNQPGYSV